MHHCPNYTATVEFLLRNNLLQHWAINLVGCVSFGGIKIWLTYCRYTAVPTVAFPRLPFTTQLAASNNRGPVQKHIWEKWRTALHRWMYDHNPKQVWKYRRKREEEIKLSIFNHILLLPTKVMSYTHTVLFNYSIKSGWSPVTKNNPSKIHVVHGFNLMLLLNTYNNVMMEHLRAHTALPGG